MALQRAATAADPVPGNGGVGALPLGGAAHLQLGTTAAAGAADQQTHAAAQRPGSLGPHAEDGLGALQATRAMSQGLARRTGTHAQISRDGQRASYSVRWDTQKQPCRSRLAGEALEPPNASERVG